VGNKCDLLNLRAVPKEEIDKFTKEFNLTYVETSAKTGHGVEGCFSTLTRLMIGIDTKIHI
jgi:GTPase SAR1 family protein